MIRTMKENCKQKQKLVHSESDKLCSYKFFVNQGRRDWNWFPCRRKGYLSCLLWILGTTTLLQCFWILFQIILYQKAVRLPLSLPVGPRIPASELQPPIWNIFAEAPSAVLENLKARCSVSYNKIKTFNEVKFNYSMPANCYHILVQDCSSELKFLVMMKSAGEATNLKAINIKIGSQ